MHKILKAILLMYFNPYNTATKNISQKCNGQEYWYPQSILAIHESQNYGGDTPKKRDNLKNWNFQVLQISTNR